MYNIFAAAKDYLRKLNSALDGYDSKDKQSPQFLKTKITFAAISLASAVLLWSFVAWDGTADITRTVEIPVKYENIGQGMDSFREVNSVKVKIEGNMSELSKLDKNELIARVDLSNFGVGKYELPINVNAPQDIRIISCKPDVAEVEIYKRAEKLLNITIKPVGKTDGTDKFFADILPATATVSGPEEQVSLVRALEARIPYEKLKTSGTYTTEIVAVDIIGKPVRKIVINPQTVDVKTDETGLGKAVALKVSLRGVPAQGYEVASIQITPNETMIKGDSAVVAQTDKIELPEIDISGIQNDLHTILSLKNATVPDGVETDGSDITVDVHLKKASKNKAFSVPVSIEGAKHGDKWICEPATVTVIAEGSRISEISDAPCVVAVDMTSIVSNKITLPLIARNIKNGIKIINIEPENATLRLDNGQHTHERM